MSKETELVKVLADNFGYISYREVAKAMNEQPEKIRDSFTYLCQQWLKTDESCKSREQKVANMMADAVNGSLNCKEFSEAMKHQHPTLQQSFTNVCLEWLRTLADTEYYDGRNELAVKVAKNLRDGLYDKDYPDYPIRLPLI